MKAVQAEYGSQTINTHITCKRWIEDQSKALAVETMYQVMLPSLGLFTVFTFILYFFAQCMESTAVKKAQKKMKSGVMKAGSSLKDSMRSKTGRRQKRSGVNEEISTTDVASTMADTERGPLFSSTGSVLGTQFDADTTNLISES